MKVWIICCSLGLSVLFGTCSAVQGEVSSHDSADHGSSKSVGQQFCLNFTSTVNHQGEFYSPFYPKTYRNYTDCIHVLTAPVGHSIRIDFRDEFHIEDSDGCQYDYLELRDGPFGYSPLIQRYCGQNHPAMFDSSSRYLWIRFRSDELIEYSGFKAVYEFFPAPDNKKICRLDIDTDALEISLSSGMVNEKLDAMQEQGVKYTEVDCTLILDAKSTMQIFLDWGFFQMPSEPVDCEDSFVTVYEDTTRQEHKTKTFCGQIAKAFSSESNRIYLRVYGKKRILIPKFNALVTLFSKGPCDAETMFDCGGDACVDKSLVCNGRVNCDVSKDEQMCQNPEVVGKGDSATEKKPLMSTFHIIILSVVGSVLLSIVLISTCITCKQHKKEEQRRKHALQQERQAIEHEMTTLINSPRSGHLRSHANTSTQAKPNGIIPGTSRNGNNSGYRYEPEPHRTARQQGGYIENHIGQHRANGSGGSGGASRNGGNGYTRYLKIKEKPEDNFPDHNMVIANQEYCDNNKPYLPQGGCFERSRLRRTFSDKTNHPRSRTPSPRPDVVQMERVPPNHINSNHRSKHARAHSADRMLDRSRHELVDNHRGGMYYGDIRETPPPANKSDCYLPYRSSESLKCQYNQGNPQEGEGSSIAQAPEITQRNPYNGSTTYPALDHSPRSSRHWDRPGSGQYVHIDPSYKATMRDPQENINSPITSHAFSSGSEDKQSLQGKYQRSVATESPSSVGSGTYARDIQEPSRSATTSTFHSPAHGPVMGAARPCGGNEESRPKLSLTSSANKMSRKPSIDYKQAPIVPERGSSNSSTVGDSPNYATVQTKQGRTKKTDSPDIFYTRPRRSEVRHEDV